MNDLAQAASIAGTAAAALVDARTGLIPDRLSRTTAALALAFAAANGSLLVACAGALSVGGALAALYAMTRGRGLGLGDVKLGVAIGAGFGPAFGLAALGAAFVAGGAVGAWLLITRRARRGSTLAFGPFLSAGTIAVTLAATGVLG